MSEQSLSQHALALMAALLAPRAKPPIASVVLLHGLARTDASLLAMARALRHAGYQVVNGRYPSTSRPLDELLRHLDSAVARCGATAERRVHFVTHSLGGILLRAWLQRNRPASLGRVIMLAPPNHGSELVDALKSLRLFRLLGGPVGSQLGTDAESLPNSLPPADYELGIIAGDRNLNPLLEFGFDGPHDGKVSVASTRLDGMRDHITLHVTHTFMMNNPLVIAQVLLFLRDGRFDHAMTLGQALKVLGEAVTSW